MGKNKILWQTYLKEYTLQNDSNFPYFLNNSLISNSKIRFLIIIPLSMTSCKKISTLLDVQHTQLSIYDTQLVFSSMIYFLNNCVLLHF